MRRLSAASRISIGLTCLTMSLLLAAQGLGVIPNPLDGVLKARRELVESLAIHCSLAAQRGDIDTIKDTTRAIVGRNPEVLSARLKREDGNVVVTIGEHEKNWKEADARKSTSTHVRVPIMEND